MFKRNSGDFLRLFSMIAIAMFLGGCWQDEENRTAWQVWASDQSNSVAGEDLGRKGSFLWVWNSEDIEQQISGGGDASPLGCPPNAQAAGPCDLLDVFPQNLQEVDGNGQDTGNSLSDLSGFGRLHGMLPDPQNRYLTANIFAPGGGYVGVIDTHTRAALALFRATGTNVGGGTDTRSVHMSFWSADGSAIIVANLNGKLLERIDATRNSNGDITDLVFNKQASLGVGKNLSITAEATAFRGNNALGEAMIGRVHGNYSAAALTDLTPNNECKENGCDGDDASDGGRPNNVIICPIPSSGGKAYVTLGGGGLLVADTRATPMTIVGEYGNEIINGAGCGGAEVNGKMWLNAGVSASGAGATQSTFTMYTLEDSAFTNTANAPDMPHPTEVFKDAGNTLTIGNLQGIVTSNPTGQTPESTTRRDAHGVAQVNGYVHNVDRIQNVVEVFNENGERHSYDLTSANGQGAGTGPCAAKSVADDANLTPNDPAPDLLETTPDNRFLAIAFRGPAPVSVTHAAQGSCPGVGIVELLDGGRRGRLAAVLRTTNTVDDAATSAPGGVDYAGAERSDIHAATVVRR